MAIQHEQFECEAFAAYLRIKGLKFAHLPNETRTPYRSVLAKNKKMGVSKGVPDYMIIVPVKISGQLIKNVLVFIEMKRVGGGVVSLEQSEWLKTLESVDGVIAKVCHGFDEAHKLIDKLI